MKGFDSNFVNELKRKCDIVEIAEKYVRLEQRGGNFWGRCPFHHEKTASFCINSVEQFYYCFGCHKSGDVITLTMELEALDFADAVKFLADKVHLPMPEIQYDDDKVKEAKRKKETVLNILKDSAKRYAYNFRSGTCQAHVNYAVSRQLTGETLNRFGIGASKNYEDIVEYLKSKGYSYEDMVDSGVVGVSSKNGQVRYYDALGGRLIIPVIDQFGNVVAFCGRIIEKRDDVGKYVNTKETVVFSKSRILFNINNLKKLKNEKGIDSVIIVEGHMDVISLVQAGFENVVASMGTALTKDHARILKRYTEKVYICYDGDSAGKNATVRGLEILRDEGLDVKVISLPDGLDPDDLIKKFGKEEYQKCIYDSKPLIDFKIDNLRKEFNLNVSDEKRKFVLGAMKIIKESPSVSEQEELLKYVRNLTGITFEALKRELENSEDNVKNKNEDVPAFNDDVGDKTAIAARFTLFSFLFNKPWASKYDIKDVDFFLDVHKDIKNYVLNCKSNNKTPIFSDLYEESQSAEYLEELGRIAGLESDENRDFDEERYFSDCVKTLKREFVGKEINRITELFKKETDTENRRKLATELSIMLKEKNKLI